MTLFTRKLALLDSNSTSPNATIKQKPSINAIDIAINAVRTVFRKIILFYFKVIKNESYPAFFQS